MQRYPLLGVLSSDLFGVAPRIFGRTGLRGTTRISAKVTHLITYHLNLWDVWTKFGNYTSKLLHRPDWISQLLQAGVQPRRDLEQSSCREVLWHQEPAHGLLLQTKSLIIQKRGSQISWCFIIMPFSQLLSVNGKGLLCMLCEQYYHKFSMSQVPKRMKYCV